MHQHRGAARLDRDLRKSCIWADQQEDKSDQEEQQQAQA